MENSVLHCKVSFRNDLRRFPMNGIGYSELQKIIQNIFGLEKEFTLQYRDNENDLVLMSSNDELACALSCISGNVLQVAVIDPASPSMEMVYPGSHPVPFHHPYGHFHHHGPHHHEPHHHGPHHSYPPFAKNCHFGKDQSRKCHRIGQKKEILSRKIVEIDFALMELSGQEEQLSPTQKRRLSGLQKKKKIS